GRKQREEGSNMKTLPTRNFINTPLQRGDFGRALTRNRFNGFFALGASFRPLLLFAMAACLATFAQTTIAFEGRINAVMTQGNESNGLLYTVGTNFLRIEMTATNAPNPVDILDLKSGALTLLFPHNRSFVRLKPAAENPLTSTPGPLAMPTP